VLLAVMLLVWSRLIVEVISMENYSSCRNCHEKVIKTVNKAIGECMKCGSKVMLMKSKWKNVARIILLKGGRQKEHKDIMFGDLVQYIAKISRQTCGNENGELSDLQAAQLHFELKEKNFVFCHSCNINYFISLPQF